MALSNGKQETVYLTSATLKKFGDLDSLYVFVEKNKTHFGAYYESIKEGIEQIDFSSLNPEDIKKVINILEFIKNIASIQENIDNLEIDGIKNLKHLQKLALSGYINFLIWSFNQQNKTGFIVMPTGQGKTLLTLLLSSLSPHKSIILTDNNTTKSQFLDTANKMKNSSIQISEISSTQDNSSKVILGGWMIFLSAIEKGKIDLSQIDTIFIDEADVNSLSDRQQIILNDLVKEYGIKIVGLSATEHQVKKQISDFYEYDILRFPMPGSLPELYKLGELPNASFKDIYLDSEFVLNGKLNSKQISDIDDDIIDNFILNSDWIDGILNYHLAFNHGKRFILGMRNNALNEFIVKKAQAKGLKLAYLEGDMSIEERNNVINLLRSGKIDGIIGSKLTGRGLDIPECDVVYNSLLTYSPQMFWQLAGRGMRVDIENKKSELVTFLPNSFIIDESGNSEDDDGISINKNKKNNKYLFPLSFQSFLDPEFFSKKENENQEGLNKTFELAQLGEKEINSIPKVINMLMAIRGYGSFVGKPELLTNMIRSSERTITMNSLTKYILGIKGPKVQEYFDKYKREISPEEESTYQQLLKIYLPNGIQDLPLYQEKEILKKYFDKKTSSDKKDKLIKELISYHYSIAIALAENMSRIQKNINIEDLLQAGLLNVFENITNLREGYRFAGFFAINVLSGILRYIQETESIIRIPVNAREVVNKVKKILENQTNQRGHELTYKEKYDIVYDVLSQKTQNVVIKNIDLILGIIEGGYEPFDDDKHFEFMEGQNYLPNEIGDYKELYTIVDDELRSLPEREEQTLRMRFGIGYENDEMELSEIGKVHDITREGVRQIEAKALRKLRHPSRSDKLRPYNKISDGKVDKEQEYFYKREDSFNIESIKSYKGNVDDSFNIESIKSYKGNVDDSYIFFQDYSKEKVKMLKSLNWYDKNIFGDLKDEESYIDFVNFIFNQELSTRVIERLKNSYKSYWKYGQADQFLLTYLLFDSVNELKTSVYPKLLGFHLENRIEYLNYVFFLLDIDIQIQSPEDILEKILFAGKDREEIYTEILIYGYPEINIGGYKITFLNILGIYYNIIGKKINNNMITYQEITEFFGKQLPTKRELMSKIRKLTLQYDGIKSFRKQYKTLKTREELNTYLYNNVGVNDRLLYEICGGDIFDIVNDIFSSRLKSKK